MDNIKSKINEIADKLKNDPELMKQFTQNPIQALEKLIGVDLPDETIEQVVAGVKAKLSTDKLSGALGSLKGLL